MNNQIDHFINERYTHDQREWGMVNRRMENMNDEHESSTPSDTEEYNKYFKKGVKKL